MIRNNDEFARYAYEMGFEHGLNPAIAAPGACDPLYRLGFNTARGIA